MSREAKIKYSVFLHKAVGCHPLAIRCAWVARCSLVGTGARCRLQWAPRCWLLAAARWSLLWVVWGVQLFRCLEMQKIQVFLHKAAVCSAARRVCAAGCEAKAAYERVKVTTAVDRAGGDRRRRLARLLTRAVRERLNAKRGTVVAQHQNIKL